MFRFFGVMSTLVELLKGSRGTEKEGEEEEEEEGEEGGGRVEDGGSVKALEKGLGF